MSVCLPCGRLPGPGAASLQQVPLGTRAAGPFPVGWLEATGDYFQENLKYQVFNVFKKNRKNPQGILVPAVPLPGDGLGQ